jgi:hypothetical protein
MYSGQSATLKSASKYNKVANTDLYREVSEILCMRNLVAAL